jgi:putative endonuclease
MSYFTYILYSKSLDRFYIGSCKGVDIRLKKHLANHSGFTGKAKDWRFCLAEEHAEKSVAVKKEKRLKGWKNQERTWQFIERCHKECYDIYGASMEPTEENP